MQQLLSLLQAKNLPNWAQGVLTLLVLALAGSYTWTQIQPVFMPADDYYAQYQKHIAEMAQVHTFEDPVVGHIAVHHYPSDGCLLVMAPGRQPRWLPVQSIDLAVSPLAALSRAEEWAQARPVTAGVSTAVPQDYVCLDCWQGIHPGEFRSWYGDKIQTADGWVWVELWREFSDGDTHFQMMRSDGYMDMHPDGTPRVCWVYCPTHGVGK